MWVSYIIVRSDGETYGPFVYRGVYRVPETGKERLRNKLLQADEQLGVRQPELITGLELFQIHVLSLSFFFRKSGGPLPKCPCLR